MKVRKTVKRIAVALLTCALAMGIAACDVSDIIQPISPTPSLSVQPTVPPTATPSVLPSVLPSVPPTAAPTVIPTLSPSVSVAPSVAPSVIPSVLPTAEPSVMPSVTPSVVPSVIPTLTPTVAPSLLPSVTPSVLPSIQPSVAPSVIPSVLPSAEPSVIPTVVPSVVPSIIPSVEPSVTPSVTPSLLPSVIPSVPAGDMETPVFADEDEFLSFCEETLPHSAVTYDGQAHYPAYPAWDGDIAWEYEDFSPATQAGYYYYDLRVSYGEWESSFTVELLIEKALPEWLGAEEQTKEKGFDALNVSVSVNNGEQEIFGNEEITVLGTHTVTLSVSETSNFLADEKTFTLHIVGLTDEQACPVFVNGAGAPYFEPSDGGSEENPVCVPLLSYMDFPAQIGAYNIAEAVEGLRVQKTDISMQISLTVFSLETSEYVISPEEGLTFADLEYATAWNHSGDYQVDLRVENDVYDGYESEITLFFRVEGEESQTVNLLQNESFTIGNADGWQLAGDYDSVAVEGAAPEDGEAGTLVFRNDGTQSASVFMAQEVALMRGREYELSLRFDDEEGGIAVYVVEDVEKLQSYPNGIVSATLFAKKEYHLPWISDNCLYRYTAEKTQKHLIIFSVRFKDRCGVKSAAVRLPDVTPTAQAPTGVRVWRTDDTLQRAEEGFAATVASSCAEMDLSTCLQFAPQAEAAVYRDAEKTQKLPFLTLPLAVGENTFFLEVVNGERRMLYPLSVYRRRTFTVTFVTGEGTPVPSQTVDEGFYASVPQSPTSATHVFAGWDSDFCLPVTEDTTVTAKWEEKMVSFLVEIYLENTEDDGFTLSEEHAKTGQGVPGKMGTAYGERIGGYEYRQDLSEYQGVITEDPPLVLKLYYTQIRHTVTYNGNGANLVSGEEVQQLKYFELPVPPVYEHPDGLALVEYEMKRANSNNFDLIYTAVWRRFANEEHFQSFCESKVEAQTVTYNGELQHPSYPTWGDEEIEFFWPDQDSQSDAGTYFYILEVRYTYLVEESNYDYFTVEVEIPFTIEKAAPVWIGEETQIKTKGVDELTITVQLNNTEQEIYGNFAQAEIGTHTVTLQALESKNYKASEKTFTLIIKGLTDEQAAPLFLDGNGEVWDTAVMGGGESNPVSVAAGSAVALPQGMRVLSNAYVEELVDSVPPTDITDTVRVVLFSFAQGEYVITEAQNVTVADLVSGAYTFAEGKYLMTLYAENNVYQGYTAQLNVYLQCAV